MRAPRFERVSVDLVQRIRLRRVICSRGGCGRSHVLLPWFCSGAAGGCGGGDLGGAAGPRGRAGWRADCTAAGRPASTVRGWLSRFAAHAEPIRAAFARLERHIAGADMDRLAPPGAVADVVGQVGAACAAVRRALGAEVFTVSAAEMVAACSGGWPALAARPPAVNGKRINTSPHL